MRPLSELLVEDSAKPELDALIFETAPGRCEVIEPDKAFAEETLLELQITTWSMLGTIAYHTGGLYFDNRWLRMLGSSRAPGTRSLLDWNRIHNSKGLGAYMLIADDVIGGTFALNAGGIDPGGIGNVFYFSPQECEWLHLEVGHSQFVRWCFGGDLRDFYEDFYWPAWQEEVRATTMRQVFSFHPPLWTKEGSVMSSDRRPISATEAWGLQRELFGS